MSGIEEKVKTITLQKYGKKTFYEGNKTLKGPILKLQGIEELAKIKAEGIDKLSIKLLHLIF